jgi:hypothetical protein
MATLSAMRFLSFKFAALLGALVLASACAGLPVRGQIGGRSIETRVDSEVARYYLANFLSGSRGDALLDRRIERLYQNALGELPDRDELKRISDDFSVDFAALYMADRILRVPENSEFRIAYNQTCQRVRKTLPHEAIQLPAAAAGYEVIFIPGFLYKRYPITGADLAAPRAALKKVGLSHSFVETVEDNVIEANAEIVMSAIRAKARSGRRMILVSVSKSGPEVALALTRLEPEETGAVAAWVNVAGTVQGSPLADDESFQIENYTGKINMAGVESMGTVRSRRRFAAFRIPDHVLVVNYIGVPLFGSVSMLASKGFFHLRAFGPNDGLALLPDLIIPGGVTLAEVGPDHFLFDAEIDVTTVAMTITVIEQLEKPNRRVRSATRRSLIPDYSAS